MRLFKKMISVGLSAILVAALVPISAFAQERGNDILKDVSEINSQIRNNNDSSSGLFCDAHSNNNSDNAREKEDTKEVGNILSSVFTPDDLLKKIVDVGIEFFLQHVVDVVFDTSFGNPENTEDKILSIVQEMKKQVDKIEKTTDRSYIRVKQAALETPLNDFIKELSKVKNDTVDLANLYEKAASIKDKNRRVAAIEKFKANNLELLRKLASRLNSLFDSASYVIQGRGNQDIVSVYDQLMAESYNFANGIPYEQRRQFRNSLASTWIFGALIVSVLDQGSTAGSYRMQMDNLYNNGKKLNYLINNKHKLEPKDVEKFDSDGARIVYCYTLGRFVRLTDGDRYSGWRNAVRRTYSAVSLDKKSKYQRFNIGYCKDKDEVLSPFGICWNIRWKGEVTEEPFERFYANNDELRLIYHKIPEGMTLLDEFKAHGLVTKENGDALYNVEGNLKAGSMVGGEKFIHNGWNDTHRWYMYVTPVNVGQEVPSARELFAFKSFWIPFDSSWQYYVPILADPSLLFALQFK